MLNHNKTSITATAPATLSNLAIGFDFLGVALEAPSDTVTLRLRNDSQIIIQEIHSEDSLPHDTQSNTATIALQSLLNTLEIKTGVDVFITKGIRCGSGMGGSAASAVAALTAYNGFLTEPLSLNELLVHATIAEKISSGTAHPDNAAPCLFGGLVLCEDNQTIITLPQPRGKIIVTKPDIVINTKDARALLPEQIPLKTSTQQQRQLALWIDALHRNDHIAMATHMIDNVIEPSRLSLWPHYNNIKNVAKEAGALTTCMSGSGPAVFTWVDDEKLISVRTAIEQHCEQQPWAYQIWSSSWSAPGAMIQRDTA